jgi:hypothetical protein
MSTNQEILDKIERLKIQRDNVTRQIEAIEKLKEMDLKIEFTNQKNFLINKFKKFINIPLSYNEVNAILNKSQSLKYYFKVEDPDNNLLFIRKVYNKYARYHEIRYEDAYEIIDNFIFKIQPINWKEQLELSKEYIPKFY